MQTPCPVSAALNRYQSQIDSDYAEDMRFESRKEAIETDLKSMLFSRAQGKFCANEYNVNAHDLLIHMAESIHEPIIRKVFEAACEEYAEWKAKEELK